MTSSQLVDELEALVNGLNVAENIFRTEARRVAYDMIKTRVSRSMTIEYIGNDTYVDRNTESVTQRVLTSWDYSVADTLYKALEECSIILNRLYSLDVIAAYVGDCRLIGLMCANDRWVNYRRMSKAVLIDIVD